MPLQKLPVQNLDDPNHRRRARETINKVLDHSFDDSKTQTQAERDAGVAIVNPAYPPGDVRRYGGIGDGVTDDSAAAQVAVTLIQYGVDIMFASGLTFLFASTVEIDNSSYRRAKVRGNGAVIKCTGAIYAFRVNSGGRVTFEGFNFDFTNNTTVIGAIDLIGTSYNRLVDLFIQSGPSESASFKAIRLSQTDTAVTDSGCFWTYFNRCEFRSSPGTMPFAIALLGAANNTVVNNCQFAGCSRSVYFEGNTSPDYTANGVVISENAFEGGLYAIQCVQAATDPVAGLRIINNRCESTTYFLVLAGSTASAAAPPELFGNYFAGAVTYLSNANNQDYFSWDASITPSISPNLHYDSADFRAVTADHKFRAATGKGIALADATGATLNATLTNKSGGGAVLDGTQGVMAFTRLTGISGTTAASENLRGAGAFVTTALTATITFATNEVNGTFFIQITPTSDWGTQTKIPWVTGKGAGGFTVNAQATTTSGTFDWVLIR